MTDGPLLWFLNRGTGVVLLALLSASTALGVLAMRGRPAGQGGARLPRFVTQSFHRNLALMSTMALVVHVVTAVVDSYVDIRWWQAFVPFGSAYEAFWMALGTLSLDVIVVIVLTSAVRHRIGQRSWRRIHLASWAAWALGVAHGVGIGTDLKDPSTWASWATIPTTLSIVVVLIAAGWRFSWRGSGRRAEELRPGSRSDSSAGALR